MASAGVRPLRIAYDDAQLLREKRTKMRAAPLVQNVIFEGRENICNNVRRARAAKTINVDRRFSFSCRYNNII